MIKIAPKLSWLQHGCYISWRQPHRVDGTKPSQHSMITYDIHCWIYQVETHQEGRFSFHLSSDATCIKWVGW